MRELHAMDRWVGLGIFLLGAGVGALTTAALHVGPIRKLKKQLLEAATHNSQPEEQDRKSGERKSA
jgi:hypothetical protein